MKTFKIRSAISVVLLLLIFTACTAPLTTTNPMQSVPFNQLAPSVGADTSTKPNIDPESLPVGKFTGRNYTITARSTSMNNPIHEVEIFVDVNGDGIFSGYVIPLQQFHLKETETKPTVEYCTTVEVTKNQYGSVDLTCIN